MSNDPLFDTPRWRVFRGPLSGRVFVARCRYHADVDRWEVIGAKHDVTDDVEAIVRDMADDN